jgi:hypothetical protein
MIIIHEENHLGVECRLLPTADVRDAEFVTIEEFKEQVESGYYGDHDCTACWACVFGGDKYCGNGIYEIDKPAWATHVYWYSK